MFSGKTRIYEGEVNDKCTILVADIGGTNSNFGLCQIVNGKPRLATSYHIKSKEINDFSLVMKNIVDYFQTTYHVKITSCCIGAAGVIYADNSCKPTNLPFTIRTDLIQQITGLSIIVLVNDFQVIGYGIDSINPADIVQVHQGDAQLHANKAIIGAGTGLGKSIMYWSWCDKRYTPVTSEGGHADCVMYNLQEFDCMHFIQRHEQRYCPLSWEEVLSGNGIRRLYSFFYALCVPELNYTPIGTPYEMRPDEIFKEKDRDIACNKTVTFYTKLYARCAKNFALDALALGGLYIAGGIAANNIPLFQQPLFVEEFVNCSKHEQLLAQLPLYVIADYNVSLYGAAAYLLLHGYISVA
jgi:glucokinase